MAEITSAKATAKTVRVSPRKTRLVIDLIRGKRVADAIAILKFTPTKAAVEVENVLNSAIANAENNFGLEKANLVVSETFINEGPTMKRFRPRAKGSASPINKRTAHITVVVAVVGLTIAVYDGRKHVPVYVQEDMVGHKLGEFAPTRTYRGHAADDKKTRR